MISRKSKSQSIYTKEEAVQSFKWKQQILKENTARVKSSCSISVLLTPFKKVEDSRLQALSKAIMRAWVFTFSNAKNNKKYRREL